MSDTPFKTPRPYVHRSDSETSTTSTNSESSADSAPLSIMAMFDDLIRLMKIQTDEKVENDFQRFVDQTKGMWAQWQIAVAECQRLQNLLDSRTSEFSELENKLRNARSLVDMEKKKAKRAEQERDAFQHKFDQMTAMLTDEHYRISEHAKEQIASFTKNRPAEFVNPAQLSAIPEINSTGSLLSEFSYTRSEDDLDSSKWDTNWRKHRSSTGGLLEPAPKKRRSSNKFVEINSGDTVRATTTVTVPKEGPITATSVIESIPLDTPPEVNLVPPASLVFDSWANHVSPSLKLNQNTVKQHSFQSKTVVIPETCGPCDKRMKFGRAALKCKECKALCHLECKDKLPTPCIPVINTPNQKNAMGIISDYTPTTAPMVPGLIVHCLNEIESRGLNELGIYRVPGSEKDVKSLKEKFLRGRGAPCLNNIDIHVICGTIKDFLRSLNDTITTYALRKDFLRAIEAKNVEDVEPALYQVISELPQPNRDTLAYMMLHLQKIAGSRSCKMPVANLAKVFGPTIVGYTAEDPDPKNFLAETYQQIKIMECLISLPTDYWSSFIHVSENYNPGRLQQTPSTDSLLRSTTKTVYTPNRGFSMKKKNKFFGTPPMYK